MQTRDLDDARGQLTDSDSDSESELNLATSVSDSKDALATVRAALEQYRAEIAALAGKKTLEFGRGWV